MRKKLTAAMVILLMLAGIQTAVAFTPDPKALKDSKPEKLPAVESLYLKCDTISINSLTKVKVLVNRLTGKIEYVFLNNYKRYVRPEFVMPDAQKLYDKARK